MIEQYRYDITAQQNGQTDSGEAEVSFMKGKVQGTSFARDGKAMTPESFTITRGQ